jgi:ADP-ribose pyrophosphatase YjhB (NUDIX family)/predicted kinase
MSTKEYEQFCFVPSERKFAILLDGMPGVGKSTIARHVTQQLPQSFLISSSELRVKHDLRNLLSDSHRARLHEIILNILDEKSQSSTSWIVLDANLMDSASRMKIVDRLESHAIRACFFHITASESDIIERTKKKFDNKPMFTRDYLDEGDIMNFVRSRMEPLQGSERDMLTIYVHYDTSQLEIQYDVAKKTYLHTATMLVELLKGMGSSSSISKIDFFGAQKIIASQAKSYKNSYIGQLRKLIGSQPLIMPSVRAVISMDAKVLLVRRRDNNKWGLPAGSMELAESISQTLQREVEEETGLVVEDSTPISVHSEPRFNFTNQFGDRYQRLAFVFKINRWNGALRRETDETIDARFFTRNEFPDLSATHVEAIEDVEQYKGQFLLK